jgi:hypothetical protein
MEPVEPEPEPEPETPAAPIGLLPDPCCFDAWPAPLEGDPSVAARFGTSGYTILPRIIRADAGLLTQCIYVCMLFISTVDQPVERVTIQALDCC